MNNTTNQGATAAPVVSKASATSIVAQSNTPIFYQLSWENWNDSDGSFHKKILGKLKQIKLSEDDTSISAQDFFLAGKDSNGHDLFIARQLANTETTAPANFGQNGSMNVVAAGEYHPVDITHCGRMIDDTGKYETVDSSYQVLVAKVVDISSATSLANIYLLNWVDWNPDYPVLSKMKLFQSGITANGDPIYPCKGLLDVNNPKGGWALGSFVKGASTAHIPFETKTESRTSFQLLQATPAIEYLSGQFSIANSESSSSTSNAPTQLKSPNSGTQVSNSQSLRNQMGYMMSTIIYQATTLDAGDTRNSDFLNTAPFNSVNFNGQKYSLTFGESVIYGITDLMPQLNKGIAPDRYVVYNSECITKNNDYQQGNIYIGLGGTTSDGFVSIATDWFLNFMATHCPYPMNTLNAQAHTGFMMALTSTVGINELSSNSLSFSLDNPLFEKIDSLVSGFKGKGYHQVNLYIAGHSQGGAVATLMAPILKSLLSEKYTGIHINTEVYTYGAPRSCNGALASNYLDMVDACYRYQNSGDPVPWVPPGKYGIFGSIFTSADTVSRLLEHTLPGLADKYMMPYYDFLSEIETAAENINIDEYFQQLLLNASKMSWQSIIEALDYINTTFNPLANETEYPLIGKWVKKVMDLLKQIASTTEYQEIIGLALIPLLHLSMKLFNWLNEVLGQPITTNQTTLNGHSNTLQAQFQLASGTKSTWAEIIAWFYKVNTMDYVHVGRLQTITSNGIQDGTGSVLFEGNLFNSLFSPNEHLNVTDFDITLSTHNMKTYRNNLRAIVNP